MGIEVHRAPDGVAFLARAGAWLLAAEAENNLILGIAQAVAQDPSHPYSTAYFAVVEADGAVTGCAVRTPGSKLLVTRLPAAAHRPLAADVATAFEALPEVMGPEASARGFAELWARLKGLRAEPGMRQGIFELVKVEPPAEWPPGTLRLAKPEDSALLGEWFRLFEEEIGVAAAAGRPDPADLIEQAKAFVWDDGAPVTMTVRTANTPHGARVGAVYTPRELRGRGYATACVAAVSQRLVEEGRRCFLLTDLANPTSNRIYQRIGYRRVGEAIDYCFKGA